MNLQTRVERLEQQTLITRADDNNCICPDALALIGTPFDKTCHQCGKAIDTGTWGSWHLITPTLETKFFAFGLLRDDNRTSPGMPTPERLTAVLKAMTDSANGGEANERGGVARQSTH